MNISVVCRSANLQHFILANGLDQEIKTGYCPVNSTADQTRCPVVPSVLIQYQQDQSYQYKGLPSVTLCYPAI